MATEDFINPALISTPPSTPTPSPITYNVDTQNINPALVSTPISSNSNNEYINPALISANTPSKANNGMQAKRFQSLDNETNGGIADFQKSKDTGVFNSALNELSTLEKSASSLSRGFVKNNNLPDLNRYAKLPIDLSGSNFRNNKLNSLSSFQLLGVDGLNALSNVLRGAPALSTVLNKLLKVGGPSAMNTAMRDIVMAASLGLLVVNNKKNLNSGLLSSILRKLPGNAGQRLLPYVGVLNTATNIARDIEILSKKHTNNRNFNNIITHHPAKHINIPSTTRLSSSEVNDLISATAINHPVITDVLKTLPPNLQNKVLSDVADSKNNYVTHNNIKTKLNYDKETKQFISSINKLSPSYTPAINNTELVGSLITSLVSNANEIGLPPLYSLLIVSFDDKTAIVSAGSNLLTKAAFNSDINTIIDIANTANIKAIGQQSLDIINTISSNFKIPDGTKEKDLNGLGLLFFNALNNIDLKWCYNSYDNVSLDKINEVSEDFNKLNDVVVNNTDFTVIDYFGTSTPYTPMSTDINLNQQLKIAYSLGNNDTFESITKMFGSLPITKDNNVKGFTINNPLVIAGVALSDESFNLSLA